MEIKEMRDQLAKPDGLTSLMLAWRANMPSDMRDLLDRLQGIGRDNKPLTRDEARRLREHLQERPEITALLSMPDHEAPRIAELKTYARWLHVFESDWPRDQSGAPDPMVATEDGRLISRLQAEVEAVRDSEGLPASEGLSDQDTACTPDQTAAKRDLDQLPFDKPDMWAAYHDATHPGHRGAVAAITALHQRAAGEPQPNQAPAAPEQGEDVV